MFTAWVGAGRGWRQEGQPVAFLQVSLTAVGAGQGSGRAGREEDSRGKPSEY